MKLVRDDQALSLHRIITNQQLLYLTEQGGNIIQLGPKLNTKLGLNHHYHPPGTFQRIIGTVGG